MHEKAKIDTEKTIAEQWNLLTSHDLVAKSNLADLNVTSSSTIAMGA
ncbi:hypothetical protein [Stenotrophomonas sp.]|nr:hypothetical protein [Stenotrophomonas sp.]